MPMNNLFCKIYADEYSFFLVFAAKTSKYLYFLTGRTHTNAIHFLTHVPDKQKKLNI